MLSYLVLLFFFNFSLAFEPSCYFCKFYIPHKSNPDLGLCKVFRDYINLNNKNVLVNNLAIHCRNNENLCGKSGFLYECNNIEQQAITNQYEELKNRCCGEVNEDDEIEQLERDFFEVFQKIKNHNKKKNYKTT